jgi:sugar lactone lactonase YvrE
MPTQVELVLDLRADLGEGPIWDARLGRLVFVNVMRGEVHAFDPVGGDDRVLKVDRPVGAVACTERGDWVLAAGVGFLRLDPETGRTSPLVDVASGRDDVRMNDGYVDARGRFWAGTMSLRGETGQGTLYRLDPDGTARAMLAPVTTSNGIDWSPDNRLMYYIDTRTRRVDVFDFDLPDGTISTRRTFVDFAAAGGRPDGLVVDADGGVWVALWAGGAVERYTPDGRRDRRIDLPVTFPSKCAFGGPTLDALYITTARGTADPDPRDRDHAGGLYRVLRPGVRGKPVYRFRG